MSSKHAVRGLTRSAAKQYASGGIRVNELQPGVISTELTQGNPGGMSEAAETWIPMRRVGRDAEVAAAVAFLLSDEASYITGATSRSTAVSWPEGGTARTRSSSARRPADPTAPARFAVAAGHQGRRDTHRKYGKETIMTTWLITGASRGFGLLVVKDALSRGDNVVASARSAQRVLDAVPDGGERLLALPVDVTDRATIHSAVAAAVERFGRIDVLMNNAGHGMVGAIEESTEHNYRAMFEVNVFGLINVTQAVLPVMRAQRSGRFINLSSVAGQSAAAGWGLYAATKHAVEAISDTLNAELAPLGIDSIAIEPGPFRTDFLDGSSLLTEQNMIDDYQQTAVATTRRWAQDTNHNQLGDPAKFGPIIVDLGHADSVPPRLALGSDTVARIESKIETLRTHLEAWRAVSESTDLHE